MFGKLSKKLAKTRGYVKSEPDTSIVTEVIEFSSAGRSNAAWREFAKKLVEVNAKHNISVDSTYSCSNGGVTYGLKFTGPKWVLTNIARKYGYGY